MSTYTLDTDNEILELTPKEIWTLINRSDREIRVIGDDGKKHYVVFSFWKTKEGKDSVTLEWNEDGEEFAVDINGKEYFDVEVISFNEEYVIWWECDIPVRFVFVQPSF